MRAARAKGKRGAGHAGRAVVGWWRIGGEARQEIARLQPVWQDLVETLGQKPRIL